MQKLVWRVKLIADWGDEAPETEVEVARIERDDFAVPETLGLSLAEGETPNRCYPDRNGPRTGGDDG